MKRIFDLAQAVLAGYFTGSGVAGRGFGALDLQRPGAVLVRPGGAQQHNFQNAKILQQANSPPPQLRPIC